MLANSGKPIPGYSRVFRKKITRVRGYPLKVATCLTPGCPSNSRIPEWPGRVFGEYEVSPMPVTGDSKPGRSLEYNGNGWTGSTSNVRVVWNVKHETAFPFCKGIPGDYVTNRMQGWFRGCIWISPVFQRTFFSFFLIPFIIFAHLLPSLLPTRNPDPGSHLKFIHIYPGAAGYSFQRKGNSIVLMECKVLPVPDNLTSTSLYCSWVPG